jgi:hypothetical protein
MWVSTGCPERKTVGELTLACLGKDGMNAGMRVLQGAAKFLQQQSCGAVPLAGDILTTASVRTWSKATSLDFHGAELA